METRTVLTWMAKVAAGEAEGAALPEMAAGPLTACPKSGAHYNPSPDEIRTAIQEIQAGWTERERLSRLVGKSCEQSWKVPWVHTPDDARPDSR